MAKQTLETSYTPHDLLTAIGNEDYPLAREIIDTLPKETLSIPNAKTWTPLMVALQVNNKPANEIAKLIIERNPGSINDKMMGNYTPIKLALENNNEEITMLILNDGNFNIKTMCPPYISNLPTCQILIKEFPELFEKLMVTKNESNHTFLYSILQRWQPMGYNDIDTCNLYLKNADFQQLDFAEKVSLLASFQKNVKNPEVQRGITNPIFQRIYNKLILTTSLDQFDSKDIVATLFNLIKTDQIETYNILLANSFNIKLNYLDCYVSNDGNANPVTLALDKGYRSIHDHLKTLVSFDQLNPVQKSNALANLNKLNDQVLCRKLTKLMLVEEIESAQISDVANAKLSKVSQNIVKILKPSSLEQTEYLKLKEEFEEYKKQAEIDKAKLEKQIDEVKVDDNEAANTISHMLEMNSILKGEISSLKQQLETVTAGKFHDNSLLPGHMDFHEDPFVPSVDPLGNTTDLS